MSCDIGVAWSGHLCLRRGRGPKAEFRFATKFKGRQFAGTGMIPCEQLPGGIVVFSSIQVSQQSGGCKPGGTEVEDEVDESVELTLSQRNADEPGNSVFGDCDIRSENGFGLLTSDAIGIVFFA